MSVRLKLTEIFYSLQGEADTVGIPTVFIRLTGCPLRCQYCDTAYAFHGGEWWQLDAILERVREFQAIVRRAMPCFVRRPRGLDIFAACGQLKREVPGGNGTFQISHR